MPIVKLYDGPWDGFTTEVDVETNLPTNHYFIMPEYNEVDTEPNLNYLENIDTIKHSYRFIGIKPTDTLTELHYLYAGPVRITHAEEKENPVEGFTIIDEEGDHEGKNLYATKEEFTDALTDEEKERLENGPWEEGDEDGYAE